jgi:CDP-diacylglycerol--glycerol-3-phosphate 3-phosphatidyltransferase
LFRILIIPALGYYISRPDERYSYIALAILILAGISDGLDGYLARKLNQVSKMGLALDPLADKILAGTLVIMLIFFRDFPIWLAGLIIGRDLLILVAAATLMKGTSFVVSSNLTGKYAFFFMVVLIGCSIIRFGFGVMLMTYVSSVLIMASIILYTHSFIRIRKGASARDFSDKTIYQVMRVGLTAIVLVVLLIKLYLSLE